MQEDLSLDNYKTQLFNAAFEAGGYDNVTIAMLECMKVKEIDLATTIAPTSKKNKSRVQKSNNDVNIDNRKRTVKLLIVIMLLLLLILIVAAVFYFGIITIDDANNIKFNLNSISL